MKPKMFKPISIGPACLLLLCAKLINPPAAFGQNPEGCLAVITDLTGEVSVYKVNSKKVDASWGLQLFKGDKIITARAAAVSLLFSNGNLIKLGANSNIEISEGKVSNEVREKKHEKVKTSLRANFSALTTKRKKEKDGGVLAGLRAVNSTLPIELVSPCNTVILDSRPGFAWTTDRGMDEFEIKLFSSDSLIWTTKAKGDKMEYPVDFSALKYGETYFWYVTGEAMLDSYKSLSQEFTLISKTKLKEVLEQQNSLSELINIQQEPGNYHTMLGAYYMNNGLIELAIEEFRQVSDINPEASLPHEILGRLYISAGKKDQAISELQKALELNKKE